MKVGSATLHVDVQGEKPGRDTLVFINSMGTDLRIWSQITSLFPADSVRIFHDMRGHGLSDAADARGIRGYADDIVSLLDQLKVERPIIIGLSVGGLIAFELARQLGPKVKGLVFSNTAAKIGNEQIWNDRIAAVKSGGMQAIADTVMQRWFTPEFRRDDNGLYALCRNMFLRNDPEGYMACCAAIREADYRESAKAIKVPSLFIGGDQDGTTPAAVVEEASRLVPGAQLEIIPGSAHLPCVEKPKVFTDLLTHFISNL